MKNRLQGKSKPLGNSGNRVLGVDGQNRSCSITWAAKQEKFRPLELCFFLTSSFIELTRRVDHSILFLLALDVSVQ
jgi:hypothetical protein